MTKRRKPVPNVDPDDYGFDILGNDWTSLAGERACMVGLDLLAIAVYVVCLRPFANSRSGDVECLSYYRCTQLLKPRQPRAGRRFAVPTKQQISDALNRLEQAGLVQCFRELSRRDGALQIRVLRRFGGFSSDGIGRGIRRGSKKAQTRANARSAP